MQRAIAFRERILDFCLIKLFGGEPHLPTFLSSTNYFFKLSTGLVIPIKLFQEVRASTEDEDEEDLSNEHRQLAAHFQRPKHEYAGLFTIFRQRSGINVSKNQVRTIKAIIRANEVDSTDYWDSRSAKELYGEHLLTYILMGEQYAAQENKSIRRATANVSLYTIPGNAVLARYNGRVLRKINTAVVGQKRKAQREKRIADAAVQGRVEEKQRTRQLPARISNLKLAKEKRSSELFEKRRLKRNATLRAHRAARTDAQKLERNAKDRAKRLSDKIANPELFKKTTQERSARDKKTSDARVAAMTDTQRLEYKKNKPYGKRPADAAGLEQFEEKKRKRIDRSNQAKNAKVAAMTDIQRLEYNRSETERKRISREKSKKAKAQSDS
jgi:hypothetical protein